MAVRRRNWFVTFLPAITVTIVVILIVTQMSKTSTASSIEADCLHYAQDNRAEPVFSLTPFKTVVAGESWTKRGRRVMELVLLDSADRIVAVRLCVVGAGRIEIPAILSQGDWLQ